MSIIHSELVFVALGIQHAIRMRHIVVSDLPSFCNIIPHYLRSGTIFGKKSLDTQCEFLFPLQFFFRKHFPF